MVFLGFCSGFEFLTTKITAKTKKNHEFWILRNNLKMVVCLVFFLVFTLFFVFLFHGFGGFSWFLQWFRALDHRNHCKNQEKPRILEFER